MLKQQEATNLTLRKTYCESMHILLGASAAYLYYKLRILISQEEEVEGGHLHMLQLYMTLLILIVHQFVSIGQLSTIIGDEGTGALLYHIKKCEPI